MIYQVLAILYGLGLLIGSIICVWALDTGEYKKHYLGYTLLWPVVAGILAVVYVCLAIEAAVKHFFGFLGKIV